jgi:hypothetical protein
MTIAFQIELIHLFGIAATLLGAYWALVVLIVKQFNAGLAKRFEVLEVSRTEESSRTSERFDRIEASQKNLDRDLLLLKAELPDKYVRREDAIRSEMTLHAKFDGLAARIDTFLRVKNND